MNKKDNTTNVTNKGAVFAALSIVFFAVGAGLTSPSYVRYGSFVVGLVLIVLAGIEIGKARNK